MSDDGNGTTTDDTDGTGTGAIGDDTGSGTTTDTGKTEGARTYTEEEYNAIVRRMQAADRTATEKGNKLAEIENSKKDELTRAKDDNTRLLAENERLKEENRKILVRADFGLAGVQWHNPATALATLLNEYPDAVSVDNDGKVVGMKAAVDKLAKEHAYLVKSAEEKKDEDTGTSAATGSVKNGKRKGDNNETAVAEALRKRMPALAARSKK